MLWIWSCPVSTKELFLKIAVPKRQTKSLKSNCEVVSFYFICKLYTWNYKKICSQAFLEYFGKVLFNDFTDFPLYGIVKNLRIYFAQTFLLPILFLIINLPMFSLFYHNFRSTFFKEHPPVIASSNSNP